MSADKYVDALLAGAMLNRTVPTDAEGILHSQFRDEVIRYKTDIKAKFKPEMGPQPDLWGLFKKQVRALLEVPEHLRTVAQPAFCVALLEVLVLNDHNMCRELLEKEARDD